MMHDIKRVVLPILRDELPGVSVVPWIEDVRIREYPVLLIRREGGTALDVELLDRANLEISAISAEGLVEADELYAAARLALFRAVRKQTTTEFGHLHSFTEILGPTHVDSPYTDTWRVLGLIRLGLRPARN